MRFKASKLNASHLFPLLNGILLGIFALATTLPFLQIISGSIASSEEMLQKQFVLIPTQFSWDAYRYIFSTDKIAMSLLVTVYLTVLGTFLNLLVTCMTAYPLAKKRLKGRRTLLFLVLFTMLFSGGMIPTFLVVKMLGLYNSLWALIIPGLISAFNLIVLTNFYAQLPEELEESAKMDGASDIGVWIRIALPLSLPAIATFSLFYAVNNWNTFFSAILYLDDARKWPIQVLLRQVVLLSSGGVGDSSQFEAGFALPPQTVKFAVIVVSTLPILLVYPFLQKHFAKGVLLGSVKG
jgi:putative aldouronate transport system permease protein